MKKPAVVMIGRFQPFTRGHESVVNTIKKMYPKHELVIAMIKRTEANVDAKKSPYTSSFMKRKIQKAISGVEVIEIRSAYPDDILDKLSSRFELDTIVCGPDRADQYRAMVRHSGKSIKVHGVEEVSGVRATLVRNAIVSDDVNNFKKLMPSALQGDFEEFKRERKA